VPFKPTEGDLSVKTAKKPAAKRGVKKKAAKPAAISKSAKTAKKPAARKPAAKKPVAKKAEPSALLSRIVKSLDDDKAEKIVSIDLAGRSSLCDAMVVASGRSTRHVAACAEHLVQRLKEIGYAPRANGLAQGDWALVDAGDIIVHVFRPEVRTYYDIEGMWSVGEPKRTRAKAK
jgi:ribosome-associated protein